MQKWRADMIFNDLAAHGKARCILVREERQDLIKMARDEGVRLAFKKLVDGSTGIYLRRNSMA